MINFLTGNVSEIEGNNVVVDLAIALSVFAAIIHLPIKEQAVLRLKTE